MKIEDMPIAYEGNRPFAFISYSRLDKDIVYPLIKRLVDRKYRLWYDVNGIESGSTWAKAISQKIAACSAFVVFLSPNSLKSPNVLSEISLGFNHKRDDGYKYIPVWITDPVEIDEEFQYFLISTQMALSTTDDRHDEDTLFQALDKRIPDSCMNSQSFNKEGDTLTSVEDGIHDLVLNPGVKFVAPTVCKEQIELKTIYIPDGLEEIGDEAFRGCKSLEQVYIPKSVKKIGDSCFRDCTSLKKLTIEGDVEIGERAFENCGSLSDIKLPDNLAEIYNGAFNSCKSLKRITLPKNLMAIGDSAFASCDKLESINIPGKVMRIDDQVFAGCIALKNVLIPESVFRIGKNVFRDCRSLEKIDIPESVRKIDSGCFRGCSSLEEVVVAPRNRYFKSDKGIMYNKNKSEIICYPQKISDEVYEVPDSVRKIDDWAFSENKFLKEVIIPDSVEFIGEGAFFKCENLEKIVIPYSVDIIQDTAFRGCDNLKDVYFDAESKFFKDLGWGIFYGCRNLVVHSNSDDIRNYCLKRSIKHVPLD